MKILMFTQKNEQRYTDKNTRLPIKCINIMVNSMQPKHVWGKTVMKMQGRYWVPVGYLFALVLAALIAGCSGGGGGGGNDADPDADNTAAAYVEDILAVPGAIVAVRVGETAILDGGSSYVKTDEPLSFEWSFHSKPNGSAAVLENPTSERPSFVADVRGTYRVQFIVSAGELVSQRAISLVEATNEGERPTGPFNHATLTSNCANCHDGEFDNLPVKSEDHVPTTNLCQACHTTFGYAIYSYVDHKEV